MPQQRANRKRQGRAKAVVARFEPNLGKRVTWSWMKADPLSYVQTSSTLTRLRFRSVAGIVATKDDSFAAPDSSLIHLKPALAGRQ